MISRREWAWLSAAGLVVLLAANLPYALAYAAPAGRVFGGVLFALQDGLSYLAKMRAGWRGEWLFTLPYTAEPGPGAFIFTYYLFLGHLARWTGLGVEAVYHLARLAGGALFLLAAYRLIARFTPDITRRRLTWGLFSLGSGLGWLAAPWLGQPPDWWIAESIPFLTLISNAHFPLAWALLLWLWELTLPGLVRPGWRPVALAALATTLLAQVQPLALPPAGVVLAATTAWRAGRSRAWRWADWWPTLVVGLCAAPWVGYAFWLTQTHPILRQWSAQNVTPSPPAGEALVWGGLPLLLAAAGGWRIARQRRELDELVIVWLAVGVALIYAPLDLQRRLSMGVWMPLALLAVRGLPERRPAWASVLGWTAATLSNWIVLAALFSAALTRRAEVYLSAGEAAAMAQLPAGARVLAAPETGTFIPARSDARVLYGHVYETVDAARWEAAVTDFFAGRRPGLVDDAGVAVVFYGPREAALGPPPSLPAWRVAFTAEDVTVYARP